MADYLEKVEANQRSRARIVTDNRLMYSVVLKKSRQSSGQSRSESINPR